MAGFLLKLKRSIAALGLASLAACAPQQRVESTGFGGHPAMWKLADADTTIYLFGTFHLLPEGREWRTPLFDRALSSSDELVLEIADVSDQMAAAQTMMKLGISPGLPPLVERVPADKKAALEAMIKESGIPPQLLDRMETWAAALSLTAVTFQRLGLNPELGVERSLTGPWKASGKPVRGLETVEEQFSLFDTLPEDAQRAFLEGVLESPEDVRAQFAQMLEAWSKGDLKGIARTFDDETLLSPELRAALMTKRNARWADWLAKRMDRPGTVFLAVGAGHLAGADSVENLLTARGLKVQRVQ